MDKQGYLSDDVFWFAKTLLFFRHSAAGRAGIFHRFQFTFADVVCRNIVLSAVIAMQRQISRIAQMTGIIGDGAAVLTGMSHSEPPIQANSLSIVQMFPDA
jgi:hypothetical protein